MRFCLTLILCSLLNTFARAQPVDVNRILKTFDFEERRLGNREDLPMYWQKVTGEGLPHYVNGRLATDRKRSGQYSFRFDLNGGSLIYRYQAGQLPVREGAHYRVETFVETEQLEHARARLTAYFADLDGHPLTDTERRSPLYSDTTGRDGWKKLSIELSADARAGSLVIELALLQPEIFAGNSLGQRTLYNQDIHGTAWFDDLSVAQVPKVTLSTDSPGNIFRRDQPLKLSAVVNDRFTDDLAAQLVIKNAAGALVYQKSGALDGNAAEAMGVGRKRMTLMLPDLKPGWYEASLVMSSQGQYVGEQSLALIRLPDNAPDLVPDGRFGIDATDLPFAGWAQLPEVLPFLSAGRVKLAVWNKEADVEQMNSAGFDDLLQRLQRLGITPTACLTDLPPSVAERTGSASWQSLLHADPATWQPQLAYLIARHANHLDRWQLGSSDSTAFVNEPNMRKVYALIYKEFADLVEKPDLAMPWPAWYELDGELPATVALSVPTTVLPSQLPLYTQDLANHKGHNLSLTLQALSANEYGRETQISDFVQRLVYALASDVQRIDLPLPFKVVEENGEITHEPQEMLLVLRTMLTTLGGATYKGRVPIAPEVEAFLFERKGSGIIVMWDRGSQGSLRKIVLDVGDQAQRVDVWGNVSPVVESPGLRVSTDTIDAPPRGQITLDITSMPSFLIGIDAQLAMLRASVALDRPLLESSFHPHTRRVQFTNPYKQAITGTFKLKPPAGWTLNPPNFTFNLNPGERFDREVTIEFPYNSFAGAKRIDADFQVQGERTNTFSVPIMLNLGLGDVGMQSLALRDGKDLVVQQMITNYGDVPIDYTAYAICPGLARQERLITNLGPGRTTIRRYRFTGGKIAPDIKVRVGIKEMVGTRILNDEITVQ